MDEETYKALKRVVGGLITEIVEEESIISFNDINRIYDWIDEVAKEYN